MAIVLYCIDIVAIGNKYDDDVVVVVVVV